MNIENQDPQVAPRFVTSESPHPANLLRCLAGAAGLAVLLAVAPGATATELLLNRSFDANGANWMVNPAGTNADFFAITGEANLHGNGYIGTLLWQNLDVPNVGGASVTASMAMNTYGGPPGKSIAVYLEYTVTSGVTNRWLLFNPDNYAVLYPPDSSVFSTNFTLPADAQRLVRFAVDKTYFGQFRAQEFSLDVVAGGGAPELGLSMVVPAEGETNTAPFLLRAAVTNLTAVVSSLVFCANGVPVGEGRLDPHGEWAFADGSHLSVMGGGGYEMVDCSLASGDMFFMNGTFASQISFSGGFQYFPAGGGMGGGAVSIVYSLDAADRLTAAMNGAMPLGSRTLSNGTNQSDAINYGFFWANALAGNYAITARAVYGSGLSVTSAPVNIAVIGAAPVVAPLLTLVPAASGNFAFRWDATIGSTYQMQTATNLVSGNWSDLGSSFVASNSPVTVTNPAGADPTRFFRVQQTKASSP